MIKHDHILRFSNLSQFSSLIHGFSTNFFGSLRPSHPHYKESLEKFTQALGITTENFVRMHQVHSNTIYFVSEKDCGQTIDKTDGLLTDKPNIFLGVVTGDCLPLLFYDPTTKLLAAVHAGWRGLYSEIIKEAVSQMIAAGSDPKDILVGLGPSIRVCCYNVDEAFVQRFGEKFGEKFGEVEQFVEQRDGKIFFNLQKVAIEQLKAVGVPVSNIEDSEYCTFDHTDVYSYRREGESFGEMIGIIGMY